VPPTARALAGHISRQPWLHTRRRGAAAGRSVDRAHVLRWRSCAPHELDWIHNVLVEEVRRDVPRDAVPRLLDGARARPRTATTWMVTTNSSTRSRGACRTCTHRCCRGSDCPSIPNDSTSPNTMARSRRSARATRRAGAARPQLGGTRPTACRCAASERADGAHPPRNRLVKGYRCADRDARCGQRRFQERGSRVAAARRRGQLDPNTRLFATAATLTSHAVVKCTPETSFSSMGPRCRHQAARACVIAICSAHTTVSVYLLPQAAKVASLAPTSRF
jgi:hypothetical protein